MPEARSPERLLCDTSFVGHLGARRKKPERYEHWEADDLDRVNKAILAISVVTLAEARYGYLKAKWGAKRIADEESRLDGFLQVPLDDEDLEEWARLRYLCHGKGWICGDNDLWIAATASTRGYPLVTCDQDQERLRVDPALTVIYFPPPS